MQEQILDSAVKEILPHWLRTPFYRVAKWCDIWSSHIGNTEIQYSDFDCRPGKRENLRYSQAEVGPAVRSAVAYFAHISGGAIKIRVLYSLS